MWSLCLNVGSVSAIYLGSCQNEKDITIKDLFRMTIMDAELVEMLKKTGAVKFGDFTLSSGRKSNYYVDKYVFETNPLCLAAIGDRIAKMIPAGTQRLAGIEIGSIPSRPSPA